MKILFFSDTHGSFDSLKNIKKKAERDDVDLIVCAGDFTIFEHDMPKLLLEMNNLGKLVLLIHGNHETSSAVRMESEKHKNIKFIHKDHHIIGDIILFGYGGGGFSSRDENFASSAEKFMKQLSEISDANKQAYRLILVTHAPSHGTKIDYIYNDHVGNKSISEFIIRYNPVLAVSGHIHETAGKEDKLHHTRVINPGWIGAIVEL